MPATAIHAYFAGDVYDILPEMIQAKLIFSRLKTFAQGSDPLLFFNIFNWSRKAKVRCLQKEFHTTKTQEYFINLLNYIKDNNLKDNKEVSSFLVGMICHYALDSTVHPYIIYKTGIFNKKYRDTYKYNNVHAFMEVFLDNDMIKRRERNNPYKFNISNYCFDSRKFSKSLKKTIGYSFYRTYDVKDMDKIYYTSIKRMKKIIKIFRQDKHGTKKFFYKCIDTIMPKNVFRFEAVSYHYPLNDKHNYLNEDHKLWRNPTTYNMVSTESFLDLYLKSLKLAKILVCASFDYLDNKNIDLEKIFTNKSYLTGIDCSSEKELKYFEF